MASFAGLTPSGPIVVTQSGAVIENLAIRATGGQPGIRINGDSDVTIRNVRIEHEAAHGLYVASSPNLVVENLEVVNVAAPAAGPLAGDDNNIFLFRSENAALTNVRVESGSSGLLARESDGLRVDGFEALDQRGPFPRGQGLQLDRTDDAVIERFLIVNDPATAWPEDNVSLYASSNVTLRDGVIDGPGSPTGMGVLVETVEGEPISGVLVENVRVVDYSNGAFSAADGAAGVTFRDVYAASGLTTAELQAAAGANFRGAATSGQEAYHAFFAEGGVRFENAGFYDLPRELRYYNDPDVVVAESFVEGPQVLGDADLAVRLPWDPPPGPRGEIVIEANADLYAGAPILRVFHEGRLLWEGAVTASRPAGESARIVIETPEPLARVASLEFAYINDRYDGPGLDRNLAIRSVEIDGRPARLEAFDLGDADLLDDALLFYTETSIRAPDLDDAVLLASAAEPSPTFAAADGFEFF